VTSASSNYHVFSLAHCSFHVRAHAFIVLEPLSHNWYAVICVFLRVCNTPTHAETSCILRRLHLECVMLLLLLLLLLLTVSLLFNFELVLLIS